MESHCYAQVFSSLQDTHFWWNFSCVRVECVWEDVQEKRLYIILLDQNREKMVAIVPRNLLHLYKEKNLLGGVFSLEHFQVGGTNYEYPRYEKYSFVRGEMEIYISKNTKLILLTSDIERQFPLFPSVTSIKTLAQDRTPRKMMIDVVGKIISIGRVSQGEEKIYYSFDETEDDKNNLYPTEFLNSLSVSGLPPHYLRLKIGCPIILLRNIDPSNGLCNGMRLICRGFQQNVIDAEIAIGQHAGKRVFLPRIPLCPSEEDMFPFKLKRKQFPIRLCFAMTINKAQGQTIPVVGVYLPESVFSHSQLYVALSRGISRGNTKVLVNPAKRFDQDGIYTPNVVYQEVLTDGFV